MFSDYDTEPCGVKLVRLINTQSLDIAKREIKNNNKMCLYRTGEYWHGFEHSAYFLARIFRKASVFVVNNPKFPFAIVGISVHTTDFEKYQQKHDAIRRKEDYIEYEVTPFAPLEYGNWHTKKVKFFTEEIDGFVHMDKDVS